QIAIIQSTTFLRRVVEKVRLMDDPEFGSSATPAPSASPAFFQGGSLLGWIQSWLRASPTAAKPPSPGSDDENTIPPRVLASINALRGSVGVARVGEGYILNVSVTSVDRSRAAKLANAVADAFVVEKLDARFEAAKRASTWLSDRLVELRKQLHDSEEAVAQFRADHHLLQTGTNITL